MPTNADAIKIAADDHMAVCKPFSQPHGHCAGFVAWWLRSRFTGKDFWSAKRFEKNLLSDEYSLTETGLAKSGALQALFEGNTAHRDYIIERKRGDKPLKSSAPTPPRFQDSLSVTNISSFSENKGDPEDCAEIKEAFNLIGEKFWAAKIAVRTQSGSAHDVALDGTASMPVYFDPNLGEFMFWSMADFSAWWCKCYLDRASHKQSAFGIMGDQFNAEYFAR